MDDMGVDEAASQYVHLGSIFFAIAIVVWTSVAVWLCYSGPPGSEADCDGSGEEGNDDLTDSVVGKVANSFAELLLEGKEKGLGTGRGALDLTRLEELLAASRGDGKSGAGKRTTGSLGKGLLAKAAGVVGSKDRPGCDLRAAPSPARAGADCDGFGRSTSNDDPGDKPLPDLERFREQLREKLVASFNVGARRANDFGGLADASGDRGVGSLAKGAAAAKREALEDFLRQLLHPPTIGGSRSGEDKLGAAANALRGVRGKWADAEDDKDFGPRPATMLSMAEHAREIGNRYLQERHFAAAAHCYEVACLLCPVGSAGPSQLAAYHTNCALACLELGRYGDAINEGHAALVLTPPKHLAVKSLYRLAVAHANLKNPYEARRCLKRALELEPSNEYARAFLARLGDEEASTPKATEGQLTWLEPPKRVQCLGAVAREKAKGRKAKVKNGASETSEVRLDREAGLWHTIARHNSKLYILGGWPDNLPATSQGAGGGGSGGAHAKADTGLTSLMGAGAAGSEAMRGSDEFHVFDVDTFELRQLSGPHSKPPHPCCLHSATMVGTNMVVFGGLGPPLDQPPIVMVFDVLQAKWRTPTTSGLPPRQRQGHTANAVQGDRHLCIFGGLEPTGEPRVARVYNDAHLLDLQSFCWRKLEAGGRRPPARFGHTATNLPGSPSRLLIIGGRDHLCGAGGGASRPVGGPAGDPGLGGFTGLHILDAERRVWLQQPYSGAPPQRAFYHSATLLDDQTLLVIESGARLSADAEDAVPLSLLDLETWRWSSPRVPGIAPSPRIGHAAAAVAGRAYVFGGAVRRGGQAHIDKGLYILEATWVQPKADKEALQEVNVANGAKPTAMTNGRSMGKREAKSDAKAAAAAVAAATPALAEPACGAKGAGATPAAPAACAGSGAAQPVPQATAHNGTAAAAKSHGAPPSAAPTPAKPPPEPPQPQPPAAQPPAQPPRPPPPLPPAPQPGGSAGAVQPTGAQADAALAARGGPSPDLVPPAAATPPSTAAAAATASASNGAAHRGESTAACGCAGGRAGPAGGTANANVNSREERIEKMLKDTGFDEGSFDDEPELTFEELLAQEKAFFQSRAGKAQVSFPRAKEEAAAAAAAAASGGRGRGKDGAKKGNRS